MDAKQFTMLVVTRYRRSCRATDDGNSLSSNLKRIEIGDENEVLLVIVPVFGIDPLEVRDPPAKPNQVTPLSVEYCMLMPQSYMDHSLKP